jgi:predicted Zn finger-like uncharacterized protein
MDIRCGSCNKLFRIADEKVSGKAVRFKCSRCGEVITVTPDAVSSSPIPTAAPSPAAAVRPAAPAVPPPPPPTPTPEPAPAPPDIQPQEGHPTAPPAGLDDFDFREPYEAALNVDPHAGASGEDGFSFDSDTTPDTGGAVTLSEDEQKEAETAFEFPADIISEPVRKPVFSSKPVDGEKGQKSAGAGLSGEEATPFLDTSMGTATSGEEGPAIAPHVSPEEVQTAVPSISLAEEEIDLGRALAIPAAAKIEEESPRGTAIKESKTVPPATKEKAKPARPEAPRAVREEPVHPLASGNATGAVSGIGCGIPLALLVLFGFSMLVKMMPQFSVFPVLHLVAVIGTGIFGMSVMTGIVIALVQAQAGKKLFFLMNVMIAALFGALYGSGMNAVTALASGAGLRPAAVIGGAISGGTLALLLGLLIVVARRIFFGDRSESFGAPVTGLQKAGIALSLIIILGSLYAEGTLIGKMERTTQDIRRGIEEAITPDGLTVSDAQAYVDPATGDLIITGKVRNGLDRPKSSWYLEVDVFDHQQKVLATVRMLNGVQLFDQRDFDILARRGKNAEELKAGMIMALQQGGIDAKGSADFELHLMDPPPGIESFYPVLKRFASLDKNVEASGAP